MNADTAIRSVEAADYRKVDTLLLAAFDNAQEGRLVRELRTHGEVAYELVASSRATLSGYVMLSRAKIDASKGLALGPMGVDPELQRTGIGKLLIAYALRMAAKDGWPWCVVLGYADYYPKFGFQPAAKFGLDSKWGNGPELMVCDLSGNNQPPRNARIEYAKAFDMFL